MNDLTIGLGLLFTASVVINMVQYWELCKLQASKDQDDTLLHNLGTINNEYSRQNVLLQKQIKILETALRHTQVQATINMHHPD